MSEVNIFGVIFTVGFIYFSRLTVGCRSNNLFYQPLNIPAMFHKINGHPVKQSGVCWQLALHTKIAGSFYQAPAKNFLPDLVYKYPRGERIIFVGRPCCKAQPVAVLVNCIKRHYGF